jgi:hypothetical protein
MINPVLLAQLPLAVGGLRRYLLIKVISVIFLREQSAVEA